MNSIRRDESYEQCVGSDEVSHALIYGGNHMKDFSELVLCDWKGKQVEIYVRAAVTAGELTISGQDLGSCVEETWGDSDYEYWYHFDRENTEKLFSAIQGQDDPKASLLREFSGEGGCRALREVCKKHGIKYEFSSYA